MTWEVWSNFGTTCAVCSNSEGRIHRKKANPRAWGELSKDSLPRELSAIIVQFWMAGFDYAKRPPHQRLSLNALVIPNEPNSRMVGNTEVIPRS